jgi:predicted MFS family arabinose efflux permease
MLKLKVLGTMLFGHLASRFGNLNVAAVVVGSCSALILLLTLYRSFTLLLIPHLFLIGTTSFACSSLLQAHLASITTPAQRDVVLGLYFTVGFGLSSIWTALTGLLIDAFASFSPAWILRATLGGVAFALIVVATRLTRPSPEHA